MSTKINGHAVGSAQLPVLLTHIQKTPQRITTPLLHRQRLDGLLTRSIEAPVTLVNAGPGTGKTLAVSEWLATISRPAAATTWLTLDQSDNHPAIFWEDILAAICVSDALSADTNLRGMRIGHRFNATEIRHFQNELVHLTKPLILVLDDLQTIRNPEVLDGLSHILQHPAPLLRVILLARTEPALRLQRMRISGQLTDISAQELAFNATEIEELFAIHGIRLTPDHLHTLSAHTEGWAVALRMAIMSLDPDNLDASVTAFSGNQPAVTRYLTDEVLEHQDLATRSFLLRASVPEQINEDLAEILTGHSGASLLLERLAQENPLLISVASHHDGYRFHPLLRQALLHRLTVTEPGLAHRLHKLTAHWYGQHEAPIPALQQAALAKDAKLLGQLLVTVALPRLLSFSPEGAELDMAIKPAAMRATSEPTLVNLLCAAAYHLHQFDYVAMRHDVVKARRCLEATEDDTMPEENPAISAGDSTRTGGDLATLADIALTSCELISAWMNGDVHNMLTLSRQSLTLLDSLHHSDVTAANQYRSLALGFLAIYQLWNAQLEESCDYLTEAGRLAEQSQLLLPHVLILSHRAVLHAIRGELDAAGEYASRTLRTAERFAWLPESPVSTAHLALALVHLQRAEWADSTRHIARVLGSDKQHVDALTRLAAHVTQARLSVWQGHPVPAMSTITRLRAHGNWDNPNMGDLLRHWVTGAEAEALLARGEATAVIERLGYATMLDDREKMCLARARFAVGQTHEAETLIHDMAEKPAIDSETFVETQILLALIAERGRREHSMIGGFTAALSLAAPERIRRPFLILGDRLQSWIRQQQELANGRSDFVDGLLTHLVPGEPQAALPPAEQLTSRELTILCYLPTMRTNTEIGEKLHVTVNTVKAHVKALYRKLGVNNRREAVERARSLGLL